MKLPNVLVVAFVAVACGPSGHHDGTPDAMTECSPEGAHRCQGATYQACVGGTWQTAVDCPTACLDALGCVACVPGQAFCKDGNVWSCDDTGNPGGEVTACAGALTCSGGACVDACADAATNKSYIGCEYWAVDLDNAVEVVDLQGSIYCLVTPGVKNVTIPVCYSNMSGGTVAGLCDPQDDGTAPHTCPATYTCQSQPVCILDAQHSPFAIVVSNPQTKDVHVTVTGPGAQMISVTIPAGQVTPILPQAGNAIPDQSVDGTIKTKNAYKITSDLPIVAYQFNPLDNVDVFSNDASLLIPRTSFDTDYYVMTRATLDRRTTDTPPTHPFYGYLTVVAWQDNTQIMVTPTAAIQASQTQSTIAMNTPTMFTLNAFDVLQLEASGSGDLTGTHVVSTNAMSFGLFGGQEAGFLTDGVAPDGTHTLGPCCADHLEEMLFPSTTWGKAFAIARSAPRADNVTPSDDLRVLAQKAGTMVTFTPAATAVAGNCANLGPGEYCDVRIATDTEITSTEPVLVGHFLEAASWHDANPIFPTSIGNGDPSMAIAVPSEQYRTDYTVLIPTKYDQNYLSISAAATGGVTVDGTATALTNFTGGATHRAARVPVTPGQHTIHCADGCGVLVYGYSKDVSYMFAGGLDLKQIVIL